MPDILHRIGITAPASVVRKAITTLEGVSGWWTEEAQGDPAREAGTVAYSFRKPDGALLGRFVMRVDSLEPAHVGWTCLEGPPDWVGTTLSFDLEDADGMTILLFGHRGWAESTESMAHCSMKWAVFLMSLREFVETGVGRPSPRDLKIDNWN